ncbi:Hemicentin-2, partial [Stegodyphus mimosarum]
MYLNVGSKPFLIKLPSSVSVEILQNISIPCIATGTPDPQISWHFGNGSNISTNSKFAVSSEGTLIIQDADLSVAGKYICRAQNRFGTEEQSLDLVITGIRKPILSPLPDILEVPKGEKKSVSCIVLDGNPKPHLTWFRNGQPLQTGYGLKIDDGRLEILKADDFHEANYSCFASNIGGSATEEMYLNILYHPEIFPTNQEFVVTEGSDITLSCNVKGDPKPAILWYKDNIQLIPNDEIYIENDGSLKIKNVRSFQEGEYICSATNIVGTSDQSMKLIIKVPPRIIHPVSSYNVTEGNIATLNCNVYAKPPALIRWKRLKPDGQENLEKYIMYNGSLQ